MEHLFSQGQDAEHTLILFHGTGGNEESLIPIAQTIAPQANYLAIRGEINEQGYLRFFRRYDDGSYDLENLDQQGRKINDFLNWASDHYHFDLTQAIFVGFSNGSNIATHLLFQLGSPVKRAILMAPLYPLDFNPELDLSSKEIFLSMGKQDPLCSMEQNQALLAKLEQAQAHVQYTWVNSHEVTLNSLSEIKQWLVNLGIA